MISITTQGSAREQGRQQGVQTARLIREIHARYAAKGVLDFDLAPVLQQVEARFPELIREMDGIAEGSGLPEDQIYRMNLMPLGAGPACSVAGFRDRDGKAWLAKTDDLGEDELGSNILRRDVPSAGMPSLQLHFAGTIWTSTAVTASGFCMAMTGLAGDPGPPDGLPPQVWWRVLPARCTTAWEAVELLRACPLNFGGMSLLLADARQTLLLVEQTTQGQCVRELTEPGGVLCHTNHTCLGTLTDSPAYLATALGRNSLDRQAQLEARLARLPRSREALQALFADHTRPGAVCQHGSGGLHTDYAVVLSPSAGGLWLSQGAPCRSPSEFRAIG
jgi:isopenicillin-N N-acyltransferase-like protein